MHTVLVQLLGTAVTIGSFALIVVVGPKAMYYESWRAELLNYEQDRVIETRTNERLLQTAEKMDRIFSLANVTDVELRYVVRQYSDAAMPNASVLVTAGGKFLPRWSESSARAALLESAVLADNDLVIFPSNESAYICTIVSAFGMVAGAMICASMVAVYQHVLMSLMKCATGMAAIESFESPQYARAALAREVLVLACSLLFAAFCLAQASVFGWLESGKSWKLGEVAFWGTLLFTGVAHSPVKPAYMMGVPQMSSWLSLCHFCMCMHTSASIGLVILSALRCFQARNSLETHPLSDEEIHAAMAIDAKRVTANQASRPLYHN